MCAADQTYRESYLAKPNSYAPQSKHKMSWACDSFHFAAFTLVGDFCELNNTSDRPVLLCVRANFHSLVSFPPDLMSVVADLHL